LCNYREENVLIKRSGNNRIEGEFSSYELTIFSNSIFETLKEIEEWEFFTRIGIEANEARIFLKRLNTLRGYITKQENNLLKMELSKSEMLIINNSLNEVLYGFHVEDFENLIGTTVSEVRLLLTKLAQAFNEIEGIHDNEQKDYFGYLR
jgi:hypothetical protein